MPKYYTHPHKQVEFLRNCLNLSSQSSGVDLGCNEGFHLAELQKISSSVYGVDTVMYPNLKNVFQLDFFTEQIPLENLDFAFIFAPYFEDRWWELETFLHNVARSLKSGGDFVLDLFDFNFMKPGEVRYTYKLHEDKVVLSTFTRKTDRVNLDRVVIPFEGERTYVQSVWRVFEFNELSVLLGKAGMYIYKQYGDFDVTKELSWTAAQEEKPKRLVIQCKKT